MNSPIKTQAGYLRVPPSDGNGYVYRNGTFERPVAADVTDLAGLYDPAGTAAAAIAAHEAASDPHSQYATDAALTAGLAGKAASVHTHTVADITDIAANYQPLDADLTAIAGLTSAADRLPYFTGSHAAALATFTTAARNLLDDATASDMRTTLGLAAMALVSAITLGGDLSGSGTSAIVATIANNAVTLGKMAQLTGPTVIGRRTGTGDPEALTVAQATGILNTFTTTLKGLVPAPGTSPGTTFLRDDATWAAPVSNVTAAVLDETPEANTTSTTTGVTLSDLGFSVVSGEKYAFEFVLFYTTGNTNTGIGTAIDGPSGTIKFLTAANTTGTTRALTVTTAVNTWTNQTAASATTLVVELKGSFVASASGTLVPKFRSEDGQTVTVLNGSFGSIRKV